MGGLLAAENGGWVAIAGAVGVVVAVVVVCGGVATEAADFGGAHVLVLVDMAVVVGMSNITRPGDGRRVHGAEHLLALLVAERTHAGIARNWY